MRAAHRCRVRVDVGLLRELRVSRGRDGDVGGVENCLPNAMFRCMMAGRGQQTRPNQGREGPSSSSGERGDVVHQNTLLGIPTIGMRGSPPRAHGRCAARSRDAFVGGLFLARIDLPGCGRTRQQMKFDGAPPASAGECVNRALPQRMRKLPFHHVGVDHVSRQGRCFDG